MSEKLEFDLSVKNNGLTKAIDEGIKKSVNLESVLNTALGVLGGNIATKGVELIGDAFKSVGRFASESIDAYAEQEDALNKLNQALRATNSFSQAAVDGVSEFASALQRTSKFGDEAIIAQVAFVKSLGASTEQSKQLVQAAANLSAVLGGSLEENTDKLGKTLSGTAGRLAQYIPELKNLSKEQLAAGAAADIINSKFGGAAANELKTYSGSVVATKNAFSDLQEEIGGILVNNSLVKKSLEIAKGAFEDLTSAIVSLKEKADGTDAMSKTSKSAEEAAIQVTNLDKEILKLQKDLEFSDKFTPGYSQVIGIELDKVIKKREEVEEKLKFGKFKGPIIDEGQGKVLPEDDATTKAREKRNADINALNAQLILDEQVFRQTQSDLQIEDEYEKQQAEIERIYAFNAQKAQINADLKAAEAASNLEGEALKQELIKIEKEKELAINKAYSDKFLASNNAANKAILDSNKKNDAEKEKQRQQDIKNQQEFFSLASSLATSKSKELAAIGKAAALTDLAIKTPEAVANSFAFGTKFGGPALGFSLGAIAATAMAAQAAKIVGVGFADGGFINGAGGATMGPDTTTAQVRDGEMVLNAGQQKQLFEAINNGNLGGRGDIIIQVEGREIARAVRDQINSGFVLA